MNTGHDGSLATLHANSAADALARLASLVIRAAPGWPLADVERQVARSIDAVVHVARSDRGARTDREVVQVVEVDPDTAAVHLLVDRDTVHRPLVRRRAGGTR
jgi:pilus assembly protein CpaF